jgi:hypothetical protein
MLGLMEFKTLFVLAPIVLLLGLGFALTLRSGVVEVANGAGLRRLVGNLSHTVVMTLVCIVLLAIVQQLIGFKLWGLW